MAANSKIEWCDHTFNPWVGCTKVSPACDHCYAESWAKRSGHPELWQGERRRTTAANWQQPIKWDRAAAAAGKRPRVFCASLADVFDNQVPLEWRLDLWKLIEQTPNLDWLLLTKRPQNMRKMLPYAWDYGQPNVWLGTTAENQEEADRRMPILLQTPAAVRFVSLEPLLGAIGWLPSWNKLDWVITGGESGPHARPSHQDWFRIIRDQCEAAGVAYFHKQNGEHWWDGDDPPFRRGKRVTGRLLDGIEHNEFPER